MSHSPRRSFARFTVSLGIAGLLGIVGLLSVGCAETPDENLAWETYSVKKELLGQERAKLAQVAREVLIHRHFFPEQEVNLEQPMALGKLVTGWNEEESKLLQGSLQGHRYKVLLELTERTDHLKAQIDDPIYARLQEESARRRPGEMPLAIGIRCIREINMNMNYREGDYERAEFKNDGTDIAYATRLLAEIRRRYNAIAETPTPGSGEGSRIGREVMEQGNEVPENQRVNRTYGPSDARPSGNSDLDFGTRRP